jgi:hypothetical protein
VLRQSEQCNAAVGSEARESSIQLDIRIASKASAWQSRKLEGRILNKGNMVRARHHGGDGELRDEDGMQDSYWSSKMVKRRPIPSLGTIM